MFPKRCEKFQGLEASGRRESGTTVDGHRE